MDDGQLIIDLFDDVGFCQYHKDNPQIYMKFKKLALHLINKGRKHYGAKAIFEVIRYNTVIEGNDDFKVNNNYTAFYARLFEQDHPQYGGFFSKRKSKFDN